jgi:His-Xaa-Ser system radical SAM maturase HxsB
MQQNKEYNTNNYRLRKFGNDFLVTTDHGSWVMLSKHESGLLLNERVEENDKLFRKLEEKGIIITEKNRETIIENMRQKLAFLYQGTSLHIVIPTLRCNQNCVYCHASSRPENSKGYDMDEATAKRVVEFVFQTPSQSINIEFQGGEPLLRFDIVKLIIEYARQLNRRFNKLLVISLVSNMTLMDEEKLKYFIDNDVGMCTSLDGPRGLHNKNRPFGKGDSHKAAVKWIRRIKEEYERRGIENRRANALITITKFSLPYWKEIVDEYVKIGIGDIFFRNLNNLGAAKSVWDRISYTPEEYTEFWKRTMEYVLELNKQGKDIREWFTWIMLRKILNNEEPNFFEQRSPCGAAIGQLAYNYNGDIYSCDEARMIGEDVFKLGNVKNNTYREIMTSNQVCTLIASSINDTQICDACIFKPYCGLCPVCNYAEHGSTIAMIPRTSKCKIFKRQFEYVFSKIINDKEVMDIFDRWFEKR